MGLLIPIVGLIVIQQITLAKALNPKKEMIPDWSQYYLIPTNPIFVPHINLQPRNYDPCSCVSYAKAVLGVLGEIWGNAKYIKPLTDQPYVGALVITKEGGGHVGVVIEVEKDRILITESNYKSCQTTQRWIHLDSEVIKGFR